MVQSARMQRNPSSPAPNPATSHSCLQATRMHDCQLKIFPHRMQRVWLHFEDGDAQSGCSGRCWEPRYQEWNQDQRDPSSKWRTRETTWVKKWIRLMDTGEPQENNNCDRIWKKLGFFIFSYFLSLPLPHLVKSLHFNSRRPLILPENVFAWSIFCFTWHIALAQPFLLSIHLRSISALPCQPCSSFEPCLSLSLKLRRWWFTDTASSLPGIPMRVPAYL